MRMRKLLSRLVGLNNPSEKAESSLPISQSRQTPPLADVTAVQTLKQHPKSRSELLASAVRLHKEGDLCQAESIYLGLLMDEARDTGALQYLGKLNLDRGQTEIAIKYLKDALAISPLLWPAVCNLGKAFIVLQRFGQALAQFDRALQVQPDNAIVWHDRGNALIELGRYVDACQSHRRALEIDPAFAAAHNSLGNALKRVGHLDEAVLSYRQALEIKSDLAEAHSNLGSVLGELGHVDAAISSCRRALEIVPDFALGYYNLGILQVQAGRSTEAETAYRRSLELKPDLVEAHLNLGILLKGLNRIPEAEAAYQHAIQLEPNRSMAYNNLGNLLFDTNRLKEAEKSYRRALAIKPDYFEVCNNLGNLLFEKNLLEEAEVLYRRALEIKPDYAEAHTNLGLLLTEINRLEEAEASHRHALEINPNFAEARFGLSVLLLSQGRYVEGWKDYECRYDPRMKKAHVEIPVLPFPQWHGESIAGKSLLICPEQGFGDYIQFSRYFPLIKKCGAARLTLYCTSSLKAMLETVEGVDEVVTDLASAASSDYWSFPMSLPMHFGTLLETIPADLPFVKALPDRVERWRHKLPSEGHKVGLVWKGSSFHKNDSSRSLPGLATLQPLWKVEGVTFVSLQKGQGEEEAMKPLKSQPLISLGSDIMDFADVAAIVGNTSVNTVWTI